MKAIAAFLLAALISTAPVTQQGPPPPDTPAPPRVTDPARPDFGSRAWAGTDVTVVVAFSAKCADCVASLPFYRRLQERIGVNTEQRGLVFLTQDGVWPAFEILKTQGFDPRRVFSYPRDDRFNLRTLPAIFLFGADWVRVGEWNGRLNAAEEDDVLAAVDRLIADARRGAEK